MPRTRRDQRRGVTGFGLGVGELRDDFRNGLTRGVDLPAIIALLPGFVLPAGVL